jgi:poly(A) polymerase
MIKMKQILMEGVREESAEDFIKQTIKGTEWENKILIAGGYVRDQLLGKDAKDLDLVANAPNGGIKFAEWFTKRIGNYKPGSNPVTFERFGTSKFNLNGIKHNDIDLTGFEIEAVMPRSEEYTAGSRKPEVGFSNLKADAERRDLTINSLFKNISTGEILDLTGKGMEDLKKGVVRTPLDPDKTFLDDPLRMMRLVRQSIKYNWKIPLSILKSVKKNAHQLNNISVERIQDELNKILMTGQPQRGIKLLQILGLNKYIAPEFESLVRMAQNDFHQWTADKHTYEVLKNAKPDIIVRLAAFFHDIGKGETRSEKDGKTHFYGHEFKSADLAKKIMTRLKYPTEVIDAVVIAVKNHMRTKSFGKQAELVSDKALRKLMNDLGDHLDNTLELIHADNISHGDNLTKWQHNLPDQVEYLRKRMKELGDFTGKLKIPIDGKDVITLIQKEDPNFKPSKTVGDILDAIKDKFLENPRLTKQEAEQIVIDTYKKLKK